MVETISESTAYGFALTMQPMMSRMREIERLFQESFFIATTIEQKMKLRIPSSIWNQLQRLDTEITEAHFFKIRVIKALTSYRNTRVDDYLFRQAELQNNLEDSLNVLHRRADFMHEKIDRMMMSAVQHEQEQLEEEMENI